MNIRKNTFTFLLFIVLGLALHYFIINYASARTITVDNDGVSEFNNIQEAIDNAMKGDVINVLEGTYYE